jgi:two-component system OmpR family sensor kinase
MTRLFISLYLVIVISLTAINWGSEYVWQQLDHTPSTQAYGIERLARTLALTIDTDNQAALSTSLALNIELVSNTEIAWLDWQLQALVNQQPVLTVDDVHNIYAYIQRKDHLYRVGPFVENTDNDLLKQGISLFSYLCLAAFIALWLRPLWRDLQHLKLASIAFAKGPMPPAIPVNNRSYIAPVLHTFNAMTTQISQLIDEQKQLTNAVSHEIRTPLSRLKFSFAMLDKNAVSQLPSMRQDVDELERLVDEMLSYGRMESHSEHVEMMDVNLEQLANNLIEKLNRHQTTNIDLGISKNLIWHCDGHLVERALQNYITNALRYTNSRVCVSIIIEHNELIICVEDDGHGINDNDRERVFNAFTRLDKSRNKDNGGFGLGLAIVKRIAQWHQGSCCVKHSSLGGAKFMLILPTR